MRKKQILCSFIVAVCVLALTAGAFCGCSPQPAAPQQETDQPQSTAIVADITTEATPEPAAEETKIMAGLVRGKVTDSNSQMLVTGILVEDEAGNTYRATTNAYGGYSLALMPGTYTLTFCKGMEYDTVERTVSVESLKTYYQQDVRLTKLFDSYAKGWVAGDAHQHSYYSDGVDSVPSIVISNASAGLYWGFLTDHNTSRGVPEWTSATQVSVCISDDGTARYFHGFDGVEVTAEFGHFNSLGSGLLLETYDLILTEAQRGSKDKLSYIHSNIEYIADCIRRVGGIAQINHPYSTTTMGAANWVERDDYALFDLFDTIEIWNGYFVPCDGIFTTENSMNQNYSSKLLWYDLLNQMREGHAFHAATGGTDNHDTQSAEAGDKRKILQEEVKTLEDYYDYWVYGGQYSGEPTTYVHLDGEVTMEAVMAALKAGNSFISSGPVVLCGIDGAIYGETVTPAGKTLTIDTDIYNRDGISEIRVVVNGETVTTIRPDAGTTRFTDPIEISADWKSFDWILIEVLGPISQYAITNPIIIG